MNQHIADQRLRYIFNETYQTYTIHGGHGLDIVAR